MSWVLPTNSTVNPDVVSTPTPTMLATTMNVAVGTPNAAGIGAGACAGVGSAITFPGCDVRDDWVAGGGERRPHHLTRSRPPHNHHRAFRRQVPASAIKA